MIYGKQGESMENKGNKGKILIYGAGGATESLEYLLTGCGFGVLRTDDGETLMEAFCQEETTALLFDFQTEAGSGAAALSLLAGLREGSEKPILAIVDKEKEMLRILALNAGADDLLDGGCSDMEALARIRAQIRCYRRLRGSVERIPLKMREIEVDDSAKTVRVRGNEVGLTPTEYKILRLLMEQPGRVLSNRQIYERIWKMEPIGADNTVAVHIRHIREKIEEDPKEPRYLQVVWGQGYKVG